MTCIAAAIQDGTVWVGGDALGSSNGFHGALAHPKVFRKDGAGSPMLLGIAGSARVAQVLQYVFTVPEHRTDRKDASEYFCTTFVDEMRKVFKDAGLDKKHDGQDASDGHVLIGYRGHLYTIYGDYQATEWATPYAAIGAGEEYAFGSLHTSADVDWDAEERVRRALEAASHFSPWVGPPFTILSLEAEKGRP